MGTGQRARRTEGQCRGLSAFGIDIDGKDLDALVPGATTVDEVIHLFEEGRRNLGSRRGRVS